MVCVAAVAAVSGLASAAPLISFSDSANPTPQVYAAGDLFVLDLGLVFSTGDLSAMPADDVAGGVSFDIEFRRGGEAPQPGQEITLVGRDNTGSPFDQYNNFNDSFGPVDFADGTGEDLGQLTFGAGVGPGSVLLAQYTFAIANDLAAGTYEIAVRGGAAVSNGAFEDVPVGESSYRFQVLVPEPGTAGVLISAVALALCRRRTKSIRDPKTRGTL